MNCKGLLIFFSLMTCLHTMPLQAQTKSTRTPRITEKFEFPLYQQGFDSVVRDWPILSNAENLLLIQDGEYILQRKSRLSPFAAMGTFNKELDAFRLVTSLKLIKGATEESSMGLIFMAQPGGAGGFIFEINQSQQYRLRQITPGGYVHLSGVAKDEGWIKSSLIKPINTTNLVELRTFNKEYDLYVNSSLLLSFSEIAYTAGGLGFIIGPGSMGKVDFINIFSNNKEKSIAREADVQDTGSATDLVALAESIIELKSEVNKLQKENEELQERIETFKGSEREQLAVKADFKERLADSEGLIKARDRTIDSLLQVNQELQRYKELVRGNDGGDLVISLSKNLKAEKLRADELSRQNQLLRDSLQLLQGQQRNPSGRPNGSTSGEKGNPTQPDKPFVLPKED